MNKELSKIFIEDMKDDPNSVELRVDPETMLTTFDWMNDDRGSYRTTTLREE
jgi:hypothetical protein